MFLVVGLGNPGPQYKYTRHNVGYLTIDKLVADHSIGLHIKHKFKAEIAAYKSDEDNVILAKPSVYMNESGMAVCLLQRYYKINTCNIIIIHDDIDLALGVVKAKTGGSHAGHNGLKSIDFHLGCNDYSRIRIGIGRPLSRNLVSNYVLGTIPEAEQVVLSDKMEKLASNLDLVFKKELQKFNLKVAHNPSPQ